MRSGLSWAAGRAAHTPELKGLQLILYRIYIFCVASQLPRRLLGQQHRVRLALNWRQGEWRVPRGSMYTMKDPKESAPSVRRLARDGADPPNHANATTTSVSGVSLNAASSSVWLRMWHTKPHQPLYVC